DGLVVEGQSLGIFRVDHYRLALAGRVDSIPLNGFCLLDHDGACDAGDPDFTVLIGRVEALAGKVPVGVVHIATIRISQLELNPRKWLLRGGIQFPDDEGALLAVVKPEGLYLT